MGDQAGSMSERSEFCQTPHQSLSLGESGAAGPPPFAQALAPTPLPNSMQRRIYTDEEPSLFFNFKKPTTALMPAVHLRHIDSARGGAWCRGN